MIAVDTDPTELLRLSESIRAVGPTGLSVECFRDPLFVLQYALGNRTDVLFASADMRRISGFELAKQLRKINPELRVYLIWENDDYREDAVRAGADGYLTKPVTPDSLRRLKAELRASEHEWREKAR